VLTNVVIDGETGTDIVDFFEFDEVFAPVIYLDQTAPTANAFTVGNVELLGVGNLGSRVCGGANVDAVIGGHGVDEIDGTAATTFSRPWAATTSSGAVPGPTRWTAVWARTSWTAGTGSTGRLLGVPFGGHRRPVADHRAKHRLRRTTRSAT
jgi:hypothetical protein